MSNRLTDWQWVESAMCWLHPTRRALVWHCTHTKKWVGCWALADGYRDHDAALNDSPEFGMRRITPKPTAREAMDAVLEAMRNVDRRKAA